MGNEKEKQEHDDAELTYFGDLENTQEGRICVQHNFYLVISLQAALFSF